MIVDEVDGTECDLHDYLLALTVAGIICFKFEEGSHVHAVGHTA